MNELGHPLVTVVTAAYNNTKRLFSTIDSVCMQTYDNIEYIVCDDCSQDFPTDQIREYAAQHGKGCITALDVYSNQKNLGTVRNLNQAYKKARGAIIMPLSCGDCFFSKDTVALVVERFFSTGCKVLATSMIRYRDDFCPTMLIPHYGAREKLQHVNTPKKQYEAFITSHFHSMIAGCNLYITKEAIEEYGYFDEKYDLWEDGPFLSRYLYNDKVEYAYDIVSIWYEDGGVSASPFDFHSPRMRADAILYASTDAVAHIGDFSYPNRRRIRYRCKRIIVGHTWKRYLVYIAYLPELMHYLFVTKRNRPLADNDVSEIERLLSARKDDDAKS